MPEYQNVSFPLAGVSLVNAFGDQRPLQMKNGAWGRTTRQGVNVRGWEALSQRNRGGSRAGLSKYVSAPVVSGWLVQGLGPVTWTGGTVVQASQSGRVVTLVAVSQGNVYSATAGATSWTAATNTTGNTPPLSYTGVVASTVCNQKVWFADGTNWVTFDPSANTASRWTASAGSLPADDTNNAPRLICTWRERVVVAGHLLDPQNYFMSAVGDPTNWDYNPTTVVDGVTTATPNPGQAFQGNNTVLGEVGDVITALIPYNKDVLIFGGDHTIFQMSGDPMSGGAIDLVTDSIGIAWGNAWCKAPDGTLFFFSNKTGIYALTPGQGPPVRISQQIEQLVNAIDTGANVIQMVWNDRFQGFHVFVTPASGAAATTHFFYEQRTGAWWTDTFANTAHNPTAVCTFDGNTPGDRVVLTGGWDGYVRAIDPTATTDDGTAISSSVLLGPLLTPNLDDITLKDMQPVLGETSGPVSYAVYVGTSAEIATSQAPVETGTWTPGRNFDTFVRWAGHAVYVLISATGPWAMESIRCLVTSHGKVRARDGR